MRRSKSVLSRLLFIGLAFVWESAESLRREPRCVRIESDVIDLTVGEPKGVLKDGQVTRTKPTYTVRKAVSAALTSSPKRASVSRLNLGGSGGVLKAL